MFQNMRSKWRAAKQYNVVLIFYQILLWQSSTKLYYGQQPKYMLPDDETHWLQWLQNPMVPVSEFLHQKYIEEHKKLVIKAAKRYKKSNTLYHGVDLKTAKVEELRDLAKSLKIDVTGMQKKDIKIILKSHQQNNTDSDDSNQAIQNTNNNHNKNNHNKGAEKLTKAQRTNEVETYAKNNNLYTAITEGIKDSKHKRLNQVLCRKDWMQHYCKKKKIAYQDKNTKLELMEKIVDDHKKTNNETNSDHDDGDDNDSDNNINTGDNIHDITQQRAENNNTATSFYQSQQPQQYHEELQYMKKYPQKEKLWYDINFRNFDSELARLQHRCECFAGAQLPGPCAHICCALWLVYYSLFDDIDEFLKETERERRITLNVNDLSKWSEIRKKRKYNCILCKDANQDPELIECDCCKSWYHPSCIGSSMQRINMDDRLFHIWHCPFCDSNQVWMVRHT